MPPVSPFAPGRFASHRNHGCRIRDIVWRSRRCVIMENELVRILISADKGCDILEFTHKPSDTEFLHQAPAGLSTPQNAFSSPQQTGPFRDLFPGGWYLMLPNGPAPCTHRGADYGHHGEATFLAWEMMVEEDRPERVTVGFRTRLRRTPLAVERRFTLEQGCSTVTLDESVTNEAGQPLDLLWGHHPTFGAPFVRPGMRIHLPRCRASTGPVLPADALCAPDQSADWPVMMGHDGHPTDLSVVPDAQGHDFIRLDGLKAGWFAIADPGRAIGLALRWDEALFPVLGYWRLLDGNPDYPWYSARTMIALEPACDLPSLADAAARGTAIVLERGEMVATRIEATAFADARAVVDVAWGGVVDFAAPERGEEKR